MVELFGQHKEMESRKSSKGNQLKWEEQGIWYKADYTGYEGLAEYVISGLLHTAVWVGRNMYLIRRKRSSMVITGIWAAKAGIFCREDGS